jgi:hypothetical protein
MNDMDDKLLNNNPLFQVDRIHIQEYVLFDMDIRQDHLKVMQTVFIKLICLIYDLREKRMEVIGKI